MLGRNFVNKINDEGRINIFTWHFIYNGAGVAVGDINNDGLTDIYFTGNQVPDRLYLNKGNFKFEDITDNAGIGKQTVQPLKLRIDGGRAYESIALADLVSRIGRCDRQNFDRETKIRLVRVLRKVNWEHCQGSFPIGRRAMYPSRFRPVHSKLYWEAPAGNHALSA